MIRLRKRINNQHEPRDSFILLAPSLLSATTLYTFAHGGALGKVCKCAITLNFKKIEKMRKQKIENIKLKERP